MESLNCLLDLCDYVAVVDVGSDDGTLSSIRDLVAISGNKMNLWTLTNEQWERDERYGKERISMYQNLAKSMLDTDYYIVLQADEIIHEDSFEYIRRKLNDQYATEGYVLPRYNFWGDCNSVLDVSEERQPCSTQVVRIAKLKYDSADDGESISVPNPKRLMAAPIYHLGFVRNKEIMKEKVKSLQLDTFRLGHYDPKLDQADYFKSDLWFSAQETFQCTNLPKYIKEWVKTRP
jgi:hypothetical protein